MVGLLGLAFEIASGDSRSMLGSCVFLLALVLGCAAAALVNIGALKVLSKLRSGRKAAPPSLGKHEQVP